MGRYVVVDIDINDSDALIDTMKEMGFSPHEGKEEYISPPCQRSKKCDIVVPEGKVNGRNWDKFGFEKVGDKYRLHIGCSDVSHMDVGKIKQLHCKHRIYRKLSSSPELALDSTWVTEKKEIKIRIVRLA